MPPIRETTEETRFARSDSLTATNASGRRSAYAMTSRDVFCVRRPLPAGEARSGQAIRCLPGYGPEQALCA